MAKQKKTKKGDPKKISKFSQSLDDSLKPSEESYKTPPSSSTTDAVGQTTSVPRKKYQKETLFPCKVMALFTEKQYADLKDLKKFLRAEDGGDHTLNSIIRDALERLVVEFRTGQRPKF